MPLLNILLRSKIFRYVSIIMAVVSLFYIWLVNHDIQLAKQIRLEEHAKFQQAIRESEKSFNEKLKEVTLLQDEIIRQYEDEVSELEETQDALINEIRNLDIPDNDSSEILKETIRRLQ